MCQKKYYVVGATVTYLSLIAWFFLLEYNKSVGSFCNSDKSCLRVCCADENMFKEKYHESFNLAVKSNIYKVRNLTSADVLLFHGEPNCFLKSIDASKKWSLIAVGLKLN